MGVSNAWSEADWHLQNNASKIYFSDLTTNWVPTYANSHHIIFLMGRDYKYGNEGSGSQAYDMKYLSNTRLWYYNVPKWGDGDNGRYQYIAFRYATSAWTNWESNTVTHRATWQNSKYTMTRNDNITGKTLYYEPESSAANTNTTVTGYLPKYSATADIKVSKDGGNTYTVTHDITLGVLTLTGTYMNGDAATGQTTVTTDGTHDYKYENIPVTGEFTLTNTRVTNDAYEFVGFGTGDKPTINSNTHTWNVTENTTYYAFYKHKQYNVTYGVHSSTGGSIKLNSGSQITSNSSSNINHGTSITFTAAPTTGYQIEGWYSDANCTTKIAAAGTNTTYNAGELTAAKTVYVKFKAITSIITLNPQSGTGGTTSVTATYGSAMPEITKPTRTGYTFNGYYDATSGGTQYYKADGSSARTWNKTAATTLYAQWTANQYNITYKDQNNANFSGSHASGYPTKHTYGTATTLKDATKTGYTFGGWHTDQACTQKVTSLGATAYTAAITLYAKWTINQYTLTYSAGEGGTVSGSHTSGTQIDYNTSVTLTATPAEGNILSQWVDENGTFVSSANQYTFNITKNTTLKAEFAPPTTVYLKPVDFWPADNARFAIYTWGAGKTDRWVEMQHVDCENQYYSANIPSGYTNFKYIRLNPAGKGNASKNDGLHFDYRWNETGNLTVQEDLLYTTPRIYLKPNNNWTQANARFAAYFFEDGKEAKWMSMYKDGDYYYCNMVEGYSKVIFCRMNPATETNEFANCWNKSVDQTIAGNCFTINANEWGCNGNGEGNDGKGAAGNWSEHYTTFTTPTYPLTLKATPYGEFTVKCNGVSHTSSRTKDIVIDLPVGATVEITNATSYDAAYNSDLVIKTSSNSQYEAAELNTTYTFCGATTIQENFTTTADHVVFLRVATSGDAAAWNNEGTNNYVYSISNLNRLNNIVGTVTQMTEVTNDIIYKENGYTYYTCTIPQGCNTFRFERKTSQNASANNYTEYFEHLLPLGQSNCFTIKGKNTSLGTFYGDWALGTADGDYRILYVEQQVAHGTDENAWKTVINTTYQHSSDIIKKGEGATIVSLHIGYDKTQHPEVILQKFTNGEWVDVEGQAHMVLGPLTASADMAMIAGRRNVEGDVNLQYGDGIEKIKDDAANGKEGRVWNFVVQQSDASAYIDFTAETFAPYTGNYYIRTDNAAGGWMTYAIPSNVMSHSEYSLEHSGYSHYFCKWVDKKDQDDPEDKTYTPNVKFVVANDYGAVISDTIASDKYTDENGTLEADANVRWMWNEYTNEGSRAYIAGSKVSNFLVAKYAASSTKTFVDKGEWVYEADLTDVKIDDKLTSIAATYDAQVQELLEKSHADAGGLVMLASAGNARVSSYTVRIVYDFKINQTICYLIPTGNAVATSIDVLIERINQDEAGQATQVTAAITPANAEGLTVYGLITLTKDHITDSEKSEQETLTYWISFPFDVKIGDITGFGEVGKHWMIKYYDGAERAEKGWFLDTKTFWKFFLDTENVMKANTGYVLTLNKSLLNESNPVYDNTETLRLYFPSKEKITGEINSGLTTTTVDIPEHRCNITSPADRTTKDSHWNMIGVPSFANKTINTTNETVKYFYDYSHKDDKYNTAQNAGAKTFKPMHAYMVQFAGTINWQNQTVVPQQLAAKKNASEEDNHVLRLELQQNGTKADQTFVELHDDATTMFDMNVDLTKMFNTGANIYTLIGSETEVAANVMPIANTVIPVGVQIATAGEYTFAMPDGTDGIVVELIDYETNTTTNLMLDEYTVDLAAGTNEARFALHVKPNKVATDMETIDDEINGVKKYIIDGKLFLQKDGMLYDAQGHIVR